MGTGVGTVSIREPSTSLVHEQNPRRVVPHIEPFRYKCVNLPADQLDEWKWALRRPTACCWQTSSRRCGKARNQRTCEFGMHRNSQSCWVSTTRRPESLERTLSPLSPPPQPQSGSGHHCELQLFVDLQRQLNTPIWIRLREVRSSIDWIDNPHSLSVAEGSELLADNGIFRKLLSYPLANEVLDRQIRFCNGRTIRLLVYLRTSGEELHGHQAGFVSNRMHEFKLTAQSHNLKLTFGVDVHERRCFRRLLLDATMTLRAR